MKKIITAGLVLLLLLTDLTAQESRTRTKKPVTNKKPVEVIDSTLMLVPSETPNMVPLQEITDNSINLAQIQEDADGNSYSTFEIGKKTWMAQNLRTTLFNDGSQIPLITDNTEWSSKKDPAYCWYGNNPDSKDFYGALYNWHAVKTGKLCPSGWHIPTDAEWTELEIYLQNNDFNYDGTVDADLNRETKNKIAKSLASESHWGESTVKGSIGNMDYQAYRNKSRFSALPSGFRNANDGSFDGITSSVSWWSSTETDDGKVWIRGMKESDCAVSRTIMGKTHGYSVRCVKN